MSVEKAEEPRYLTRNDITYLEKRIGYLEERLNDYKKRLSLLVRILVDRKIVGGEIAKSIEETKTADETILKQFLESLEESVPPTKSKPKYKVVKVKGGKFAVMVATGKKFPPMKVVQTFDSEEEAKAFIKNKAKKSK